MVPNYNQRLWSWWGIALPRLTWARTDASLLWEQYRVTWPEAVSFPEREL